MDGCVFTEPNHAHVHSHTQHVKVYERMYDLQYKRNNCLASTVTVPSWEQAVIGRTITKRAWRHLPAFVPGETHPYPYVAPRGQPCPLGKCSHCNCNNTKKHA